jgi:DNA-3-methyladenine glycosylase I
MLEDGRKVIDRVRCEWCGSDPIYVEYHDKEWGIPVYDNRELFELLNLEGAQAGLSWITVLKKRSRYRTVFDNFEPKKMANYDEKKRSELLSDAGIIRNKLKVNAFIENAKAYLNMEASGQDFSEFIWGFVDGKPLLNCFDSMSELPAQTELSQAMSSALKGRGFKFVGPTICYAFMQAAGMVNDHTRECFRYFELSANKI